VIERQQPLGKEVLFRAGAASRKPEVFEALDESNVKYGIRLPANHSLECEISKLVTRSMGGPTDKLLFGTRAFSIRQGT
jgi:hypothetical protein